MRTRLVSSGVLLVILAYAIARYVGFGTVAPAQLPVFVLNKALAVTSVVLIAIALAIGPLVRMRVARPTWMASRKAFGIHGFVLGMLHSVLTIATLSSVSYAKLYDRVGKLTFEGGLAVLGGVLALATLVVPAITSATLVRKTMAVESWRRAQRLGIVALAIGVAHVTALGWRSWLVPATWPGGLPPLTTIAIAAGVLAFVIRGAAVAYRKYQYRYRVAAPARHLPGATTA